ncbi:BZ3500_MvSof-1268-A1-R1_Chr1-2g01328 [Microbotryum saponariae]|uniref:BZ3500_MvSof-1268-A1-R1_Chr1-2g01328 protein n=1 Tax=Microbotryum saponariae TaxID=289078 RepID=A0A2X0MI81_9BASI|nr:BZ3500_MvSof-1268-A1-R1_Chr1-2g01328 [Microbotryum saponariae]SCZ97110.1 BZ3501_MvSof-1269-A2-R1_Chr1-2g00927 [Microbotryum saponariae]
MFVISSFSSHAQTLQDQARSVLSEQTERQTVMPTSLLRNCASFDFYGPNQCEIQI